MVTTVPLAQYFGRETARYFLKCAILVKDVAFELPGVFGANPYKDVVNGSLWTMTWEVRSYIVLLLVWWTASRFGKWSERSFLSLTGMFGCALFALMLYLHVVDSHWIHMVLPVLMFTLGAAAWQLRQKISLSWLGFGIAVALLGVTSAVSVDVFYAIYPAAMAYAVMFLAFVPGGVIRKYNSMGDYSYGLYLYAFLIQQLLAMVWVGITPAQMIVSSFALTMVCAVVSWHLVEQRALGLKTDVVRRIRLLQAKFASA